MSRQLISHSVDLRRLRDEGYDVEIKSGHLLINSVPYVNSNKEIKFGILVSELNLAGDVTTTPNTHVVYFVGDHPCNKYGSEIAKIKHQSAQTFLDHDLVVQHSFSSKPNGGYKDYYEKMATYVAIISSPARSLDPSVTATPFLVTESVEEESVFNYIDTASTRAGISAVSRKLELGKLAVVGLGGTGSYVLDLVAKTPVREIHLFDRDLFLQHNAFRSPGAPSINELRERSSKVAYLKDRYSRMHRYIFEHDYYIDSSNIDELRGMDFVFLCVDNGSAKKLIAEKLEEFGTSFIDVGMGVNQVDESLIGVLRVTSSTVEQREHVRTRGRIPFSNGDGNNDYDRNIQIADLNALNATLAVIKWKKLCGFYLDLEKEYHCTYTIDGNKLINEDQP
jgi:uncharacterized protein DUF6791/ThiF family protein